MDRWNRAVRIALLASALVLGLSLPSAAEIYRWKDAQGRDHFAMDLSQVPPAYRSQAASGAKSRRQIQIMGSPQRPAGPAKQDPAVGLKRDPNDPKYRLQRRPGPGEYRPREGAETAGGRDEHWWRGQLKIHQQRVRQAEQDVRTIQNPSRGVTYSVGDKTGSAAVEQTKQNVEIAKRQLEEFRDRARRAGVKPGWVR